MLVVYGIWAGVQAKNCRSDDMTVIYDANGEYEIYYVGISANKLSHLKIQN